NVALYPEFHRYFATRRPPLLAAWGRNDPFFLPAGAEAYRREIPEAEVHLYDTGHFALETHAAEIAAAIRTFLGKRLSAWVGALPGSLLVPRPPLCGAAEESSHVTYPEGRGSS